MSSPKPATISTNLPGTLTKFIRRSFGYKADKAGIIYASFAKTNFLKNKLIENLTSLYQFIKQNFPTRVKGRYFKIYLFALIWGHPSN